VRWNGVLLPLVLGRSDPKLVGGHLPIPRSRTTLDRIRSSWRFQVIVAGGRYARPLSMGAGFTICARGSGHGAVTGTGG